MVAETPRFLASNWTIQVVFLTSDWSSMELQNCQPSLYLVSIPGYPCFGTPDVEPRHGDALPLADSGPARAHQDG